MQYQTALNISLYSFAVVTFSDSGNSTLEQNHWQ